MEVSSKFETYFITLLATSVFLFWEPHEHYEKVKR